MDPASTITENFRRLRRRPLITPLVIPLVLFALVVAAAIWTLDARDSAVVIMVRHAEIDSGSDPNPALNEAGRARAAALQRLLAEARPARGVDAIYVADNVRSQQTATPVAESMGLVVNVVPQGEWRNLPAKIRRDHSKEVVLVVADGPALQSLLEHYQADESDEDALVPDPQDASAFYVVTAARLSRSTVIRLRY